AAVAAVRYSFWDLWSVGLGGHLAVVAITDVAFPLSVTEPWGGAQTRYWLHRTSPFRAVAPASTAQTWFERGPSGERAGRRPPSRSPRPLRPRQQRAKVVECDIRGTAKIRR